MRQAAGLQVWQKWLAYRVLQCLSDPANGLCSRGSSLLKLLPLLNSMETVR
jgi:hypothetical protein